MKRVFPLLLLLSLSCQSSPKSLPLPERVEIGSKIENVSFTDIRYLRRTLDDFGEQKGIVLVFTTTGCPVANRYLPRLARMEKKYRKKGIQFVAVNVGSGDSVVDMASSMVEHKVGFPVVKDWDGEVAKAVGARRTPEVVLLDGDRILRYRGHVDSQYRVGGVSSSPGRADLREAIEDLLAGREIEVTETEVDGCKINFLTPALPETPITFTEHVAPIVQKNCQSCHRPGGEAPFSLTTYASLQRRAEMVAEVVREERMPPWFADPRHGSFRNSSRMSPEDRQTIVDWVKGGLVKGDPSHMPAPIRWKRAKWKIAKPDLVLTVPKPVKVPADGYIPYQYASLHRTGVAGLFPYVFPEDTWIEEVQIKAQNTKVLHHANLGFIIPGKQKGKAVDGEGNFITGQVPGGSPMQLEQGVGFMIPKGAVLALQMHYVTVGKETEDRASVGIVFAKNQIVKQLRHMRVNNNRFRITPGSPAHEVRAKRTIKKDSTGIAMYVHMHLRGKDMTFTATYPDGRKETLLVVANYSFDWQLPYMWKVPKVLPAGTVVECVAHFDNSPFNPYNPDPTKRVKFGPQTFHEMMYGFLFFIEDLEDLELKVDPKTGQALSRR